MVPDEGRQIERRSSSGVAGHALVVTTGGTGPDAARRHARRRPRPCIDYEVPGLAEAMRAEGRRITPMAALSRGRRRASAAGRCRQPARQPARRDRIARGDRPGAGARPRNPRRAVRSRPGATARRRTTAELRAPTDATEMFADVRRRPGLAPRVPAVLGRRRRLRARHGPPPADLRRRPGRGSEPVRERPARGSSGSSSTRSSRPGCSATCGPALMHAGIFWGFVLLTIGTANIVTGGLVQAVISWPLDGRCGRASRRCRTSSRSSSSWRSSRRSYRRLVSRPRRLTLHPRRADHPGDDRRGRGDGAAGRRSSRSPVRRHRRARSWPTPWRSRSRSLGTGSVRRPDSRSCGGPTSRWSRRSSSTCRSASTSTSSRASSTSTSASSRHAASCRRWTSRPRTRRSACKTLQDLGWKDLLDGFTCTECGRCQDACPAWNTGQAAQPQDVHHGHPRHVRRGRARPQPHPELADRPRDVRPRRPRSDARRSARRSSTTRSRMTRSGTA